MTTRDTSLSAFLELIESGARHTLQTEVYRAILSIGPVHNMRLLEYLQQKEKVNKPKEKRIAWTRSNCWPRVTDLVSIGAVIDAGRYRLDWLGKNKTLHVWYVASANTEIPSSWKKVETKISEKGSQAQRHKGKIEAMRVSSASQAGRVLQACRHKNTRTKQPKSGQKMLFKV